MEEEEWTEKLKYIGIADLDGLEELILYDKAKEIKLLQKARSKAGKYSVFLITELKKSEFVIVEELLRREKKEAALHSLQTVGFEVPEDMLEFAKLIPREKLEEAKNGGDKK